MALKTKKTERKDLATAFYQGKISKISIKEINGTDVLEISFRPEALNFDITKSIWLQEDRMWVLDLLFESAKCTPIEVTEDPDGSENRTWEENHLVGKPIQALMYKTDYINIWEFVAPDATDEVKSATMAKLVKYLKKNSTGTSNQANPVTTATPATAGVKKEDDDLPF